MRVNKSLRKGSSKSECKFILIHGQSKQEEPIRWHWLTQKFTKQQQYQDNPIATGPRLTYSEKKTILTQLQGRDRVMSSFKIREGFSRKEKVRVVSTAASGSKSERRSLQPFIYLNSTEQQLTIPNLNFHAIREDLISRMADAHRTQRPIIALLSPRRMGLRYKLYHSIVDYCPCNRPSHAHQLGQLSSQVKVQLKEFSRGEKELYYFFLDGEPLHSYADLLQSHPPVLLFDTVPKLQLSTQLLQRIAHEAQKLQDILKLAPFSVQKDEKEIEDDGFVYDWQRIANVKQYVDLISEDPAVNMLQAVPERKSELANWYNERYREESARESAKESNRNPLFESKSHFPMEMLNKKLLGIASEKVESLSTTNNRHKFIPARLDLMMELVRRQTAKEGEGKGKEDVRKEDARKVELLVLERKNSLLSTQNIPYLMEKYGLSRFQLYNLYNLYKSFEKVSVLRHQNVQAVLDKGIDRETFESGLKGLDMNPGEELIKNICYFGDFISWEQFIKIISISLRKTPEEKLTAILKGISSADDGFLSRLQISLMIGNSLQKLFDREEAELREYFTEMAMKELDQKGQGRVAIETLKQKILGSGSNNLTMVSFLILNT